jgi:hypothetical protein
MKKIIYAIAALLMVAGLSSCNAEIKDPKINNLIGTWDMVSETRINLKGETTTNAFAKGENYWVIKEKEIEQHTGKVSVTEPFSFGSPYLIIDGSNRYEIVSLSYSKMVLKDNNILASLLLKEKTIEFQRR